MIEDHEIQRYVYAAAQNAADVAWVGYDQHGLSETTAYAELLNGLKGIPRHFSWNAEQATAFKRHHRGTLDAVVAARTAGASLDVIRSMLRERWVEVATMVEA